MKIERGMMIFKDGKAWGLAYQGGGHGDLDSWGWVAPEDAKLYDPRYISKPTDATYNKSPHVSDLQEGRLVLVSRTTMVEPLP